MYWNDKVATVLSVGMPQPFRTRYFAIIQIAVHDALNNIKPKYKSYSLDERTQNSDPNAAVASAAYWAIKGLNLQGSFPVDEWYTESLATVPDGESEELGKTLGKHAAESIIANRANDGFTQIIPASVNPPNGVTPGAYRSTLTAVNSVPTQNLFPFRILPNWGTVMKPYVIQSNQQFRPAGPYAVNSNEYTQDFNEVKTKAARVGGSRSADEEKKAQFWSENTPSIIWNNFVRKAIEAKKMDAWKTARLFALMHVSMAESISSTLNAAYHFYFWRPETAVRLAATDGNNSTEGDADWLPFLSETPTSVSPPIPSYSNAFAAYGGTTAEILRLFFGSDETSIDITIQKTPLCLYQNHPSIFPAFHKLQEIIHSVWFIQVGILENQLSMVKRWEGKLLLMYLRIILENNNIDKCSPQPLSPLWRGAVVMEYPKKSLLIPLFLQKDFINNPKLYSIWSI